MRKRKALIATLPKSGTWYCHTFFWFYDQLLSRSWDYLDGRFTPDISTLVAHRKMSNRSCHTGTMEIDALFICHTICPGFETSDDAKMSAWKTLHFPLPSNWGEAWLRKQNEWEALDPACNPETRIVYLFRNPLDHFISFWEHSKSHVDERQRTRLAADGRRVPIKDLHEFVFDFGMLGAFIKHYYSFLQMHKKYPERILMMPYERLTLNPQAAFREILTFLGAPPAGMLKERLFADALTMCSKESLMAVEAKLGSSLAGDQMKGGRHIRDGGIGKWKTHFSRQEIEVIESAFNAFGLTLKDFTIGEDAQSPVLASWLDAIDPALKARYQKEFFLQQNADKSEGVMSVAYHRNTAQRLYTRLRHEAARVRHAVFKTPAAASDEAGI